MVIGNVVGQSSDTQNPVLIAYGAEGKVWDRNRLLLSHNTLISDFPLAWFLRSWPEKLTPDTQIRVVNNLTVGLGLFSLGLGRQLLGQLAGPEAHAGRPGQPGLRAGARRHAARPGRRPAHLAGDDAVPTAEFTLPIGTQPLQPPARWSPGAFQR